MAITLEIAGTDRTDWLKVNTCHISRAMNGRSACDAVLEDKLRGFVPALGNTFVVKEGATKRFAGNIRSWSKIFHPGTSALQFRLRILDYHHILDKRRVTGDYQNMTLRAIVLAIVANFLDGEGVTTVNVATGPTIAELVRFNFNTATEAFNKLSQISGNYGAPYLFYLDFDKDLHFSQFTSNPAPFSLTDTSDNWFDMEQEATLDNYRNVQYVRTEYEAAATYTESFVGDGVTRQFITSFLLIDTPAVTVNSVAKTIGEFGVNHTGKDFYWIRNGYGVFNQDHATLTGAQTLAVTYQAPSSNVARKSLAAEIAARATAEGNSGKHEAVDEQRNIPTLAALEAIADGDLEQWGAIPTKVSFGTRTSGLEIGHRISINVTKLGINASYLVESLDLDWVKAATDFFVYRAACTDVEQFGSRTGYFEKLLEMARIGAGPTQVTEETPVGVRHYVSQYTLITDPTSITSPATTGIGDGDILVIKVTQDATGGRTLSFSSDFDSSNPTAINPDGSGVAVLSYVGASSKWLNTSIR